MSANGSGAASSKRGIARWPTWLRQLGWPGVLGAGLLLGCAGFIELALPQRREAVAQTESEVRRLRHGLVARADAGSTAASTPAQADPAQSWAQLWFGLPDEGQRLAMQARVLDSAQQVGVPLQAVQWQGETVKWIGPVHGLWRQRMVMPVQATYPALRTWLDRLQREPALTVDALDIQRNDLQSDQVSAQVSLSLWWRQTRREAP